MSIVSVGVGVAGVQRIAAEAGADRHGHARRAGGATIAVAGGFGCLGAAAFALFGPGLLHAVLGSVVPNAHVVARWFALLLFAEQLSVSQQYVFEGHQRVDIARAADALRRTLVIGAIAAGAVTTGRVDGAIASGAISALACCLIAMVLIAGRGMIAAPTRGEIRRELAGARRVAELTALGVAHRSMDRMLSALLFGPRSVAIVEVATQVQNAAAAVLSSTSYVATASSPWLVARGAAEQERALLLRGSRLVTLATVPVALVLGILARPLLDVWLPGATGAAAALVPIAMVFIVLSAPLQVPSNMLFGKGETRAIARAAIPALAVNLVASLLLSQWLGVAGLLWGSVVGAVALAAPLFRAIGPRVGVGVREFSRDVILPCVLPAIGLTALLATTVMLRLGDLATIAIGLAGGATGYALLAWQFALPSEVRDEVSGALRRGAPSTSAGRDDAPDRPADDPQIQRE